MKSIKIIAALSLACAAVLPSLAQAQTYPNRAITFVVPYTPGTTADVLARLLGAKIATRWGVPVVVDNKTGASGIIGTTAVAKAAPDGYTFLFPATSYGTIPALTPKLPFDPVKSFASVALLGTSEFTLVTNMAFAPKSVREFIAEVKKQPGVLNYASPGNGSSQHLAMELLKLETGINLVHVPYKGTAGALTDMVGGHVQASAVSMQTATPLVKAGKLRMLAVMSRDRAPNFPDVPTMTESGYPNVVADSWYGVMAPAGTPPAIIAKMNAELNALLAMPDVKEAMSKQGVDPYIGAPEKLDVLLRHELKLWSDVVARGKIAVE